MTLILVNSSAIRAVGYDGYILTVEFHTGRIYDHHGVSYSVYVEFMNASSMALTTTKIFAGGIGEHSRMTNTSPRP
jgi:hypothetical protein